MASLPIHQRNIGSRRGWITSPTQPPPNPGRYSQGLSGFPLQQPPFNNHWTHQETVRGQPYQQGPGWAPGDETQTLPHPHLSLPPEYQYQYTGGFDGHPSATHPGHSQFGGARDHPAPPGNRLEREQLEGTVPSTWPWRPPTRRRRRPTHPSSPSGTTSSYSSTGSPPSAYSTPPPHSGSNSSNQSPMLLQASEILKGFAAETRGVKVDIDKPHTIQGFLTTLQAYHAIAGNKHAHGTLLRQTPCKRR